MKIAFVGPRNAGRFLVSYWLPLAVWSARRLLFRCASRRKKRLSLM
jgi:hypothetical protein